MLKEGLFEFGFNFFKRNIMPIEDKELENYVLSSFNKIKRQKDLDLEKIIFYNLFMHEINNKLILIFRTTNIFDLTGHVWRNNVFPRYLLNHGDLTNVVKRILDRTDRGILKKAIENKNEVVNFIKTNLGHFNSVSVVLNEIKDSNLESLLHYAPDLEMSYIDVIKDIRNILVHGFSVKNIYFYSPLEKRFEKYFFKFVNNEKINKLFDMMFFLNLAIFRVINDDQTNDHITNVEREGKH